MEQTATAVPASRLTVGIRFSLLGMVIRNGLIADGIDVTAHLE